MTRKLTPADFKNPATLRKVNSRKNIATINGKEINKKTQQEEYQIEHGTQLLEKQGLVTFVDSLNSLEQSAVNLLSTLGCSISSQTKEYSLLSQQTDTETIENANIFDENAYQKLQNKKVKATDKFVNVDDPFYKLDDAMPNKNTIQNRELVSKASTTNVQKLMSDLVTMNVDNSSATTLKQFR